VAVDERLGPRDPVGFVDADVMPAKKRPDKLPVQEQELSHLV
jgi:hypothetical protein